jgi:hypothetical protein
VNSQQKKNRIVSSAQKTAERRCFQQKQQGEVQAGRKWRSRGANPPAGDHGAAEKQGRGRQKEQRNAIDADHIADVQPDIQFAESINWKPVCALSKAATISSDSKSVSSVVPSAIHCAHGARRSSAVASAPPIGSARSVLSRGRKRAQPWVK